MKNRIISLLPIITAIQIGITQTDLNGLNPSRKIIPYEYVREADVLWSKRVWELIDLREKMNHPLYYPLDDNIQKEINSDYTSRWCLWSILKKHILNGELTLYSTYNPQQSDLLDGDGLKYPIEPIPGKNYYSDINFQNNLFNYFGKLDVQSSSPCVNIYGEDSSVMVEGTITFIYPPRDTVWIKAEDIIQYRIKEDWFYDKERSMMDVRIIAIAPVIYTKDESGQILGLKELFWLYFPHCRLVLNNYLVFNEKNDSQWMNFDDLFLKRRFSSIIYKESNVYDRNLNMYTTSADALYEATKIKEEISKIEHDIWSF
jgi:gliding motility associated protien GldN